MGATSRGSLTKRSKCRAPITQFQKECAYTYRLMPSIMMKVCWALCLYFDSCISSCIYIFYCLHWGDDAALYPNPDKFDPERFSEGNIIPANAFLPFGDGKLFSLKLYSDRFVIHCINCIDFLVSSLSCLGRRKCVGYAFAKLLIQTGLVSLLPNFKFSTCERTQIPIQYSSTKNTLIPENGVWLKVQRI